MTRYLTGASNPAVRAVARDLGIGLLVQPRTKQYLPQLAAFDGWAIDNGCFNARTYVGDAAYMAWLATLPRSAMFATAPDVVGDAAATLARSAPFLAAIRGLGFPAALVAQDGLESLEIPWDTFDVLFVGGSTEWKLGGAARAIVAEAKRRGKPVHMGRVNSGRRFALAQRWDVDTVDGTFLAFGPDVNLARLRSWLATQPAATLAAAA